jgi:hypothetical protein
MALKGNKGTLHTDVRTFQDDPQTRLLVSARTVDADNGLIETLWGEPVASHSWGAVTSPRKFCSSPFRAFLSDPT